MTRPAVFGQELRMPKTLVPVHHAPRRINHLDSLKTFAVWQVFVCRSQGSGERGVADVRERVSSISTRARTPEDGKQGYNYARERLRGILEREEAGTPQGNHPQVDGHTELEQGSDPAPKPSIRERLDDVLNKPREKLDIESDSDLE